jgi:hypothetical protein
MALGMDVAGFSSAAQWQPYARRAVRDARRGTPRGERAAAAAAAAALEAHC